MKRVVVRSARLPVSDSLTFRRCVGDGGTEPDGDELPPPPAAAAVGEATESGSTMIPSTSTLRGGVAHVSQPTMAEGSAAVLPIGLPPAHFLADALKECSSPLPPAASSAASEGAIFDAPRRLLRARLPPALAPPLATSNSSLSTPSAPRRSTRNFVGGLSRSTWIRAQRSSKVSTGTPPISTMTSPTSKPHFSPSECTRTTFVSKSSSPSGRCSGRLPTSIDTTGLFRRASNWPGFGRTRWKPPSLSPSSSNLVAGSGTGWGAFLIRITRKRMATKRSVGITSNSQTQEPCCTLKLQPSSSKSLPEPGGGKVEVIVVVMGRYCTSGSSTVGQVRGVHLPLVSQQNSVIPEHSVSHITGMSRGQRPLPRWLSQQAQPSSSSRQRCPSKHSKTPSSPLSVSQGHVVSTWSSDMAVQSCILGRFRFAHCSLPACRASIEQSSGSQSRCRSIASTPRRPNIKY
mmetsp:Transcript_82243/g.206958  ORF Transcript_82243/g.206958 Transcript_82243/m.206958 type:complete len:460 (-) Transcript_82243:843-2222(-)